jgi:hypothetical protein
MANKKEYSDIYIYMAFVCDSPNNKSVRIFQKYDSRNFQNNSSKWTELSTNGR